MSLRNVGIVYRKELTEALRDRRTLISTIVVPLLLFPLLSVGFGAMAVALVGKAKDEIPKVMVLGGKDSPAVVEGLKKLEKIEIVPAAPNWKDQVVNKEIRAAVEIPSGFQTDIAQQKMDTVKIYIYEGEMKSSFAADKIEKHMNEYRQNVVKERLAAKNLPETVLKPFEVKQENVAPPEKVSGAAFGGIIGYMVILLCLQGGMYPAIDLTAGEKERGTMETILSSPISRMHLVLGKFFLVLTAALGTAALSVLSMGVSFSALNRYTQNSGSQRGEAAPFILHLGPKVVLSVFLMALPLAVLFLVSSSLPNFPSFLSSVPAFSARSSLLAPIIGITSPSFSSPRAFTRPLRSSSPSKCSSANPSSSAPKDLSSDCSVLSCVGHLFSGRIILFAVLLS